MTNADACSLVYVLVSPNSPLYTCRRPFLPTPPGVCDLLTIWLHTSTFDHMDLPSSLNSAFHNGRTAVGEPAQGVDNVGVFSVIVLFFVFDT